MSKNLTIIQCQVLPDSDFSSNSMPDPDSDFDSDFSSGFINLVIFVSIHDSVKKLFMSFIFMFSTKKINTFDVLTIIQMRTVSKITTKFLSR